MGGQLLDVMTREVTKRRVWNRLFAKSSEVTQALGRHVERMLVQMNDRGPDSAGVAIYRDPAPAGCCKLTLQHPDEGYAWKLRADAVKEFGGEGASTGVPTMPSCMSMPSLKLGRPGWRGRIPRYG